MSSLLRDVLGTKVPLRFDVVASKAALAFADPPGTWVAHVARLAGCDRSHVTAFLADREHVKPGLRDRIAAAIARDPWHYRP